MDIKKDVIEPIAAGITVLALLAILQWILTLFGLAPFNAIAIVWTVPGFVGLVVVLWVVGKLLNRIRSFVEGLLKSL